MLQRLSLTRSRETETQEQVLGGKTCGHAAEEKEEAGGGCRLTINSQPSRETHSAQGFRLGKMIWPRARPPSLTVPVPGSPFLCAIVGGVHQQLSLCYAVSKD